MGRFVAGTRRMAFTPVRKSVPWMATCLGQSFRSLGSKLLASHKARAYDGLLADELQVEPYRSLLQSLGRQNPRREMIGTGDPTSPTARISTEEIGARRGEVLVFVHGVFADRTMWRFVAGALAPRHNLLLIDLPGCGDSDKPHPTKRPESIYSPQPLARRILQVLRAHLRTREDAPRIRLIAHSLGGAIAIRMFACPELRREFQDVIDRIDAMVLLAPLDVAIEKEHPTLTQLLGLRGVHIWSARGLGKLRKGVAKSLIDSRGEGEVIFQREADHKTGVLTDAPSRRAMQAMLYHAVPRLRGRPVWREIDQVVARYPQVTPRTLVIWGEHDEVLPLSMGYKLVAQLPDARLTAIPKGGHSLVLERPELIAQLAHEFFASEPPPEVVTRPLAISTRT